MPPLPVQVGLCVIFGLLIGQSLSIQTVSFVLAISNAVKEVLMWILPWMIWSYLSSSILEFKEKALWLVLGIVGLVILFNMTALVTVYSLGSLFLPYLVSAKTIQLSAVESIQPMWQFPYPCPIKPEWAVGLAVASGIVGSLKPQIGVEKAVHRVKQISTKILNTFLIPLLPLYVLGFVLKLDREGTLYSVVGQCAWIFPSIWAFILVYIFTFYWIGSSFSIKKAFTHIYNMLPAGLTAFSTMSSMAALPFTLKATEKNLGKENQAYGNFVVPATVNNHMMGDNVGISLTALTLLLMTGQGLPSIGTYVVFLVAYCFMKFSAAGVPGGGVIVILPVVKNYLGLNDEITSLLATLYIVQDSLFTSANVMGNGAFALVSKRILQPIFQKHVKQKQSDEQLNSTKVVNL